jgi:general secretion pathway protein H
MPTSVTGTSEDAVALKTQRGFTLLELLVVVAIIGLLVGAATLSMGALGNDREIEQEARRLRSMIGLLNEEALMQTRDYGVMFTETGYRFLVFDYQQSKWVEPLTDELLERHTLEPQLSLRLFLDGRDVPLERNFEAQDVDDPEPQIMLLSSGEVTPFMIELTRYGNDGRYELTAELDGTVTVTEEDFD